MHGTSGGGSRADFDIIPLIYVFVNIVTPKIILSFDFPIRIGKYPIIRVCNIVILANSLENPTGVLIRRQVIRLEVLDCQVREMPLLQNILAKHIRL